MRSLVLALAFAAATLEAGQAAELCSASPAVDRARVSELFAKGPHGPLFSESTGRSLGLSETAVLSLLPPEVQVITQGAHFASVWKSLETWPEALFLITKDGQIFEVQDKVRAGAASARSRFFNLATLADGEIGLSGHLRPDLFGAIVGIDMPGRDGPIRGIAFHDLQGAYVFGVYVPSKHGEVPDPKTLQAFESTRAAIRALPRLCPDTEERNPAP